MSNDETGGPVGPFEVPDRLTVEGTHYRRGGGPRCEPQVELSARLVWELAMARIAANPNGNAVSLDSALKWAVTQFAELSPVQVIHKRANIDYETTISSTRIVYARDFEGAVTLDRQEASFVKAR